ncbi:hypothetical protein Tco_0822134 [Tanacetum coccineum]|uniref:Uncharacterized protein n=1 Tax=Tanacetum coccineum TaxID=301880 RepID=A0ABQ5AE82_9ASTR
MSDEVLREMCDKNYHQLLPLIAEKMQKEKEQKDKLNAVKARLIYGEESGIKIRSREESHYSESKTPTARTEPRRRHGGRLRRKEPTTSARPDSRQRSPQAKRVEVEAKRRQQKETPSRTTSQYSESEDSEWDMGTTSFLQGEVAALSHGQRESALSWKPTEGGNKPNFKKGFKNKQRLDRKLDRFSLLTKTPKGNFLAWKKEKFKAPPQWLTPVKMLDPKQITAIHSDTDIALRMHAAEKAIDEMNQVRKNCAIHQGLKQNDKAEALKKGEASGIGSTSDI